MITKEMFLQICKELDFPAASLPVLENARQRILEKPETVAQFEILCESMLHPDCNVFGEVAPKLAEKAGIHPYTLNMVLQICCIEPLRCMYAEKGFTEELFKDLVEALRQQLMLCMDEHQIWGNVYGLWQWMFHEWQCVKLGRLVFEPLPHFSPVSYEGIRKGDPVILIHIPGGSPLDMDAVMDSLRQGYEYFKGRYPNGIVPFVTHSWLLYQPYMDSVFPKNGNIQKFASLFHILSEDVDDTFENFPSVFGCSYRDADFTKLPQNTALQRNLLAYLKQGNPMGEAYGIFFYNEQGVMQ